MFSLFWSLFSFFAVAHFIILDERYCTWFVESWELEPACFSLGRCTHRAERFFLPISLFRGDMCAGLFITHMARERNGRLCSCRSCIRAGEEEQTLLDIYIYIYFLGVAHGFEVARLLNWRRCLLFSKLWYMEITFFFLVAKTTVLRGLSKRTFRIWIYVFFTFQSRCPFNNAVEGLLVAIPAHCCYSRPFVLLCLHVVQRKCMQDREIEYWCLFFSKLFYPFFFSPRSLSLSNHLFTFLLSTQTYTFHWLHKWLSLSFCQIRWCTQRCRVFFVFYCPAFKLLWAVFS